MRILAVSSQYETMSYHFTIFRIGTEVEISIHVLCLLNIGPSLRAGEMDCLHIQNEKMEKICFEGPTCVARATRAYLCSTCRPMGVKAGPCWVLALGWRWPSQGEKSCHWVRTAIFTYLVKQVSWGVQLGNVVNPVCLKRTKMQQNIFFKVF